MRRLMLDCNISSGLQHQFRTATSVQDCDIGSGLQHRSTKPGKPELLNLSKFRIRCRVFARLYNSAIDGGLMTAGRVAPLQIINITNSS
jgi:hypothetical protein